MNMERKDNVIEKFIDTNVTRIRLIRMGMKAGPVEMGVKAPLKTAHM